MHMYTVYAQMYLGLPCLLAHLDCFRERNVHVLVSYIYMYNVHTSTCIHYNIICTSFLPFFVILPPFLPPSIPPSVSSPLSCLICDPSFYTHLSLPHPSLPPSLLSLCPQWDLYYKGSELYHKMQWQEMVDVFERSLLKLPDALQQCRDECYGPMKLGRAMGFAQVHSILSMFLFFLVILS